MFASSEWITVFSDETKAKVGAHLWPIESTSRSYFVLSHLDMDFSDINLK